MPEYSKCPHCGSTIDSLKVNQMPARYKEAGMHTADTRNCWVFSCPMPACSKIISVQNDPIQGRDELATAIADLVAKKFSR